MSESHQPDPGKKGDQGRLWPAAYVLVFFLTAGLILRFALNAPSYLFLMATIGLFSSLGLVLHCRLKRKSKPLAHTVSLLAIGLGLFFGAGVFGKQNLQLEGMFFNVLLGIMGAGLIHYLVAKIVGPLFVGRLWCGWGCWTFAVLNLLPCKKAKGKAERAPYSGLRYVFFFLMLALVAALVLKFKYTPGEDWKTTQAHIWFLAGNLFYFVSGAVLVLIYRDNRAFCKVLCPITSILKLTGRFSLLKIGGTSVECNSCGACVKRCPMNIDIPSYVAHGCRVLSSECVLCRQCVATCPYGSVELTLGLDFGRKDIFESEPTVRGKSSALPAS